MVSKDEKGKMSYISAQYPLQENMYKILRHATIRSLSCEVYRDKESAIYFGDDVRGHILSFVFSVKDITARGFFRRYSIIAFLNDEVQLLNSFQFISKSLRNVAESLKSAADKVYDHERAIKKNFGTHVSERITQNIGKKQEINENRKYIHVVENQKNFQSEEQPNSNMNAKEVDEISRMSEKNNYLQNLNELKQKPNEEGRSLLVITGINDLWSKFHVKFSIILKAVNASFVFEPQRPNTAQMIRNNLEVSKLQTFFRIMGEKNYVKFFHNFFCGSKIIFESLNKTFVDDLYDIIKALKFDFQEQNVPQSRVDNACAGINFMTFNVKNESCKFDFKFFYDDSEKSVQVIEKRGEQSEYSQLASRLLFLTKNCSENLLQISISSLLNDWNNKIKLWSSIGAKSEKSSLIFDWFKRSAHQQQVSSYLTAVDALACDLPVLNHLSQLYI